MNDRQANSLAQAWIEAWNRHDLDAIVQRTWSLPVRLCRRYPVSRPEPSMAASH